MDINEQPLAIVWDLDGTLIDSATDLALSLNTLLSENKRHAIHPIAVRGMIGDGVAKLIERVFAVSGKAPEDDELASLVERFMTIYAACATDNTRLYLGARKTLQCFQNAGIRQGICTNKPEALSWQILHGLCISKYFDVVVGGDSTPGKKPDPLPLRVCLRALRGDANNSIMIGDSAVDVATAHALNMPVGIVAHGYAREPVDTLGADFLISNLKLLSGYVLERIGFEKAELNSPDLRRARYH